MFEDEYRMMNERVFPDRALVADTYGKMKAMLDRQKGAAHRRLNRKTLLTAILALALLGATALALTQPMAVDWSGNRVDIVEPELAITQEELKTMQAKAQIAKEMFLSAPDDELWVAEIEEETQLSHRIRTVYQTLEDMAERIKAADDQMLVPSFIPDGYRFVTGTLWYYTSEATRAAGVELISEELTEEGILLKKFRVPGPYEMDIESYIMELGDDRGNSLEITCRRDEASSIYSFTVNDGGSSESVSVAGMTDGIYIWDENAPFLSSMHLRRNGMPPKEYFELPVPLTYSTMDERPAVSRTYDAAVYDFRADDLGKDALLSIAESMK